MQVLTWFFCARLVSDEVIKPLLMRMNVVNSATYCQWLQQFVYG